MSIDFNGVKQAVDGRCCDAIAATTGIPAEHLTKGPTDWPCAQCGGESVFYVDSRDGGPSSHGRVCCRNCTGAKPTSDIIDTVQRFGGHKNAVHAAKAICDHLGLDPAQFGIGVGDRAPESHRGDIVADVAKFKQAPVESLKRYGAKAAIRNGVDVCRCNVYGPDGCIVGGFDMSLQPGDKGKLTAGAFGIFLPGRIPAPGETWLLCEGVKDSAALDALGFNVAGRPGKAMPPESAGLFAGCHVLIVADLDESGFDGANKTERLLRGIAASIRLVRLPGEVKPKNGDDVRDVLRRFGEGAIHQAVSAARPFGSTDLPAAIDIDLSDVESLTARLTDGRAIRLLLGNKAQPHEVGTSRCARDLEAAKGEPASFPNQPASQQSNQAGAADAEPLQNSQPLETRPQGDVRCDVCGDAMARSEITIGGWVNFDCQNCGHVRPVQVE